MKRILYNANIRTLDEVKPRASAMAIANGSILAVGQSQELLHEFERFKKIDLQGQFVLPGLTDAHVHFQQYAENLQVVNCETGTLEECLQRVALCAKTTPPGEWIHGHGWNQNRWEGGFGSAEMLDKVAPQNPVYLTAKSLHASWVNHQAMQLAGISKDTPDLHNGRISRDRDGNPDGILFEDADQLVSRILPDLDLEALVRIMRSTQIELWKVGLTGIHDFDQRESFSALQVLQSRGELGLRVVKSIPAHDLEHAIALGLRSGFGGDMLRIGSLKLFADGALGPHTAAMLEPFQDDPANLGMLNLDKEMVYEIGREASVNGISLAVHAIGDRANHEVLDGFASLREFEKSQNLPMLRHRVEHVQLLHPQDCARLHEINLIASMQPIHATSDHVMAEKYWGERNAYAYAWRTLADQNTQLAFGSDAPVESPNPFMGLHAAVTRRKADGSPGEEGWHAEQRLSLEEAWRGFTQGPAYAAGMETKLGKLAEGYLADLIVMESDPFAGEPQDLFRLSPQATMVAGNWVWGKYGSEEW